MYIIGAEGKYAEHLHDRARVEASLELYTTCPIASAFDELDTWGNRTAAARLRALEIICLGKSSLVEPKTLLN